MHKKIRGDIAVTGFMLAWQWLLAKWQMKHEKHSFSIDNNCIDQTDQQSFQGLHKNIHVSIIQIHMQRIQYSDFFK